MLLMGVTSTMGATKATSNFVPNYMQNVDTNNYADPMFLMFDGLKIGSAKALNEFNEMNIWSIAVGVYQSDGTGGFHGPIYPAYNSLETRGTETLDEAIIRVTNAEFKSALVNYKYPLNQKFKLKVLMYGSTGTACEWFEYTFTPIPFGSTALVPNEVTRAPRYSDQKYIRIPWFAISRASLVIYDRGKLIRTIVADETTEKSQGDVQLLGYYELAIARRLLTNGYTGTLTVSAWEGQRSGMYSLSNGAYIPEPMEVKPLMRMGVEKDSVTINIFGGAPQKPLVILRWTNLNSPPREEIVNLDDVGSGVWKTTSPSPSGFFTTTY